jgi:hypothetical protein
MNKDELQMPGSPGALDDENIFGRLVEESMNCAVFSEQH